MPVAKYDLHWGCSSASNTAVRACARACRIIDSTAAMFGRGFQWYTSACGLKVARTPRSRKRKPTSISSQPYSLNDSLKAPTDRNVASGTDTLVVQKKLPL